MNNLCDDEWLGYTNAFNTKQEHYWLTNLEKINFSGKKTWQKYVDSKRLEITCGEAPFLTSRYDTTTGEVLVVNQRIGIIDRKLRVKIQTMKQIGLNGQKEHMRQPMVMNFKEITCS